MFIPKQVTLIFPPRANATYVPLGITMLAGMLKTAMPELAVNLVDMNIRTWHWQLQRDGDPGSLFDFVQNKTGSFYDWQVYTELRQTVWLGYNEAFEGILESCTRYLAEDVLDPDLKALQDQLIDGLFVTVCHLIGFSVLFPRQVVFTLALCKRLKALAAERGLSGESVAQVLLGGAALSTLESRELLAASPFVDLVVVGEGELPLKQLCSGVPPAKIPGLIYRHNGQVCRNAMPAPISLKTMAPVDFSLLPLSLYFNPEPVLPVFFSRGCAWQQCRFCAHNFSFASYRCKGVKQFVDELEHYLHTYGARHFYFVDQYLIDRTLEQIAAEIRSRHLPVFFHCMGRPVNSRQDFAGLYAAGCRWISWGLESGSQRLVDICRKGTNVKEAAVMLQASAAAGINNLLMMIFGLPGSDERALEETLNFLNDAADAIASITRSEFVLYKETPFARNPSAYNLQADGAEVLCRVAGRPIHSYRLYFHEKDELDRPVTPRGKQEVQLWDSKKHWCYHPVVYHNFNAEHYLLYAASARQQERL